MPPVNDLKENTNIMQQSAPVENATAKKNKMRNRLDAFDKKLRQIIFNNDLKKAK